MPPRDVVVTIRPPHRGQNRLTPTTSDYNKRQRAAWRDSSVVQVV